MLPNAPHKKAREISASKPHEIWSHSGEVVKSPSHDKHQKRSDAPLKRSEMKPPQSLYCKCCSFHADRHSKMVRHFETQKHKKRVIDTAFGNTWICKCGKVYKHRQSFNRHGKVCGLETNDKIEASVSSTDGGLKELLVTVMEENKELHKMMVGQQKQIEQLIPHMGNTINNTFNLQLFLNEDCKEALNMTEFIESLNIRTQDLEHTQKYGLSDGVLNIFLNGLREVGTYKRPIHCTDSKRETLYIKDDNEWERVKDSRAQIRRPLSEIADKQRKAIRQWEEANPDWEKTDKGKDEWIGLIGTVMGTVEEDAPSENRIIKGIAKEVKIN